MLLVLDSTTRKFQAKMAANAVNTNCSVTCTYADTTASSFTEGIQPSILNGLTLVDILSSPNASTRRVIKSINVFNNDTITHTVTIYLIDGPTSYAIKKITLAPNASWASDDVSVEVAVPEGDKGDITVSGGGTVWTIDSEAVTTSKLGGDITAAGKALLDDATASAQRSTLGLGSIAVQDSSNISISGGTITGITDLAVADGGTGASNASGARTNLGAAASGANTDITSVYLNQAGLKIKDSDASHGLVITPISNLTGDRILSLVTGDANRTLTLSADATIAGTNTGDQNIFSTVAVAGQNNIVADTTSDTLTLVAGNNISITTNEGSDSITIESTSVGVTAGNKGDISVSSEGVWTINSGAVVNSDLSNMNNGTIKAYPGPSASGPPEDISISRLLDFTGAYYQGNILYRGATGWFGLPPGTAGQALITQGPSQDPTWASISTGQINFLINGDFSISQRTKPGTTVQYTPLTNFRNFGGNYTHDRWFVLSSSATGSVPNTSTTNIRVAQGNPSIANTTTNPATTSCILQGQGAVVSKFGIAQIIDKSRMAELAGKSVTLSFQAKMLTGQLTRISAGVITVADGVNPLRMFVQSWNVAGSTPALASSHAFITSTGTMGATPSLAWTNYVLRTTIPATTPGNVIIFIWADTNGASLTDSLIIQDVQFEIGVNPSPFQRLTPTENLAKCLPYFYAKYGVAGQKTSYGSGSWNPDNGVSFEAIIPLPVKMRTSPTVRFPPRVFIGATGVSTTLRSAITAASPAATGGSLPVTNASPFAVGAISPRYIKVTAGSTTEIMSYTGISTTPNAHTLTGITRNLDNSLASSFISGSFVGEVATPLFSQQFALLTPLNSTLPLTYIRLEGIQASGSAATNQELRVIVTRNDLNNAIPYAPSVLGSNTLIDSGNGLSYITADAEI